MTSHVHHARPTKGDIAYETFYAAALGGLVIALFFLVVDLARGQPLFTPSLMGSVLFFGAEPTSFAGMDLTAMALFTVAHMAGFGVLGLVASLMVRSLEERTGGGFFAPVIVLFVLLEGGFLLLDLALGVGDIIGQGLVLAANGLVAVTMTLFLRQAHGTGEAEGAGAIETEGA